MHIGDIPIHERENIAIKLGLKSLVIYIVNAIDIDSCKPTKQLSDNKVWIKKRFKNMSDKIKKTEYTFLLYIPDDDTSKQAGVKNSL